MDRVDAGILGLALAAGLLLAFAWRVGVQGALGLVSPYRRHPERFPDGEGLGRWVGWTLAAGGASFGLCALSLAGGLVPLAAIGPWAGATGAFVAAFAVMGLARFRRCASATRPARPWGRGRR